MEGAGRFRKPLTEDEEYRLVENTVPKNTQNSTKWAVKLFEEWQKCRHDKIPKKLQSSSVVFDMSKIEDLSTPLHCMNAETLNLWLTRFVEEVRNVKGERYPPRTLYVLICGLKRYLNDKSGLDPLNKNDKRFVLFRKIMDGEMRDATKNGVDLKTKKDVRNEVTLGEEELLWRKGLLGNNTAECLLNTIYFYNGKLFGLRSNEHRLLRVCNISLKDNFIIFDESVSKTFHGGLKDLKKSSRVIKHKCHEIGENHSRCLQSLYRLYLSKITECVKEKPDAFYFRPQRNGSFSYEKSAIGINSLNKILPDKLCARAGLERKTSHCLRITCASRLFQHSVNEKQIRERTGHKSDSLFRYEKASDEQTTFVSNVLGAPSSTESNKGFLEKKETQSNKIGEPLLEEFVNFDVSDEFLRMLDIPSSVLGQSGSSVLNENLPETNKQINENEDFLSNDFGHFDVPDELLGMLDIPDCSNSNFSAQSSTCTSSSTTVRPVFQNCVFNGCNNFWKK